MCCRICKYKKISRIVCTEVIMYYMDVTAATIYLAHLQVMKCNGSNAIWLECVILFYITDASASCACTLWQQLHVALNRIIY